MLYQRVHGICGQAGAHGAIGLAVDDVADLPVRFGDVLAKHIAHAAGNHLHRGGSQYIQITYDDVRALRGPLNLDAAMQQRRHGGNITVHGGRGTDGDELQSGPLGVDTRGISYAAAAHGNEKLCVPRDGQQHLAAGPVVGQHVALAVDHARRHGKAVLHQRLFHVGSCHAIGVVIGNQHAMIAQTAPADKLRNAPDQAPSHIDVHIQLVVFAGAIALQAGKGQLSIGVIGDGDWHDVKFLLTVIAKRGTASASDTVPAGQSGNKPLFRFLRAGRHSRRAPEAGGWYTGRWGSCAPPASRNCIRPTTG